MRKLNYFGQNFSRLKLSGFILASIGAYAGTKPATQESNPPRKKEVTQTTKTQDVKKVSKVESVDPQSSMDQQSSTSQDVDAVDANQKK